MGVFLWAFLLIHPTRIGNQPLFNWSKEFRAMFCRMEPMLCSEKSILCRFCPGFSDFLHSARSRALHVRLWPSSTLLCFKLLEVLHSVWFTRFCLNFTFWLCSGQGSVFKIKSLTSSATAVISTCPWEVWGFPTEGLEVWESSTEYANVIP